MITLFCETSNYIGFSLLMIYVNMRDKGWYNVHTVNRNWYIAIAKAFSLAEALLHRDQKTGKIKSQAPHSQPVNTHTHHTHTHTQACMHAILTNKGLLIKGFDT